MRLAGAALLLALSAGPACAIKVESLLEPLSGGPPVEVVAEQALVRFSTAMGPAQRDAALSRFGYRRLREVGGLGWTVVGLPPGLGVAPGLQTLRALSGVAAAAPNHVHRVSRLPNDPLVSSQYALSQINAFGAWEFEVGASSRVTIAVIDAGIDTAHPDLAGKFVGFNQYCTPGNDKVGAGDDTGCVADPANPPVACRHGTQVAGIAAAKSNNGSGIAGLAWDAQLISLRVFRAEDCTDDCSNEGVSPNVCATDDAAVAQAIDYIRPFQNNLTHGKIVINMSLGGPGGCADVLRDAIGLSTAAGIPVIVAAGNTGGAVNSPANCATATGGTGIIPVGATDSSNNVASFSSRGPELSANGLVAPGVSVLTTSYPGGGTATASGTSFAAPHVAGVAALILAAKPTFSAQQVQTALRGGADNIGVSSLAGLNAAYGGEPLGSTAGSGRLDAFRALRLAVRGTLADFEGDQKAIAVPNPFRVSEHGTVALTIPQSLQGSGAKIKVYTSAGQFVRELSGQTWDGKNKDGRLVASGMYVFVVSTSNGNTTGRVAVIR